MNCYLDASTQHPYTFNTMGIIGMLMSTISGAAGDTTGGATGATFYYLLKNRDTLTKLRTELRDAADPAHPSRTPRPETSLTLTPRSKKPWASSPS